MTAADTVRDAASGPVTFRRARADDLTAIVGLFVDDAAGGHGDTLEPASAGLYRDAMTRIQASPNDRLYVAEQGARVVGTFQLTFIQTLVHRGRLRANIESVHVASALRGRGVGGAMMRFAIAEARAAGAGVVQLTSNKRRLDAHRFYERLGFEPSHQGFKIEF